MITDQPIDLANPENQRRGADDDAPILPRQRNDVEHLAAEGDNQVLAHENHRGDKQETLALLQVGERRASFHEGFRVEHVPELHHHEETEEPREVVRRQSALRVEMEQQPDQNRHERAAHAEDVVRHRAGDDEVAVLAALAGFVFHDALIRWQRCQRAGGERIHDEVHPQHLRDGQGRLGA